MTEEVKENMANEQPEETVEEPSLDELLNEYDAEQPEKPEQPEQPKQKFPPDYDNVRYFAEQYAREHHRKEIDSTVSSIKELGENLKDVDNEIIEGVLQGRASRDQRIAKAWMYRHEKPGEWNKIAKSLAKELDEKFRRPDKQVTEDREALRAAVKSGPAGDDMPTPAQLNQMSDAEFEAYKAKL